MTPPDVLCMKLLMLSKIQSTKSPEESRLDKTSENQSCLFHSNRSDFPDEATSTRSSYKELKAVR